MANYRYMTPRGYNMYDMSSMMQKAIRRGDIHHAAFAAYELYCKFYKYVWKRLIVVSAEDCYGIITKEIIALKAADDIVNDKIPVGKRDPLFLSKAVTLLCLARKNRDGCYVACNFMQPDMLVPQDEIPHVENIVELTIDGIPDWVYDCHTIKGKMEGKDAFDMVTDEQAALSPLQPSLFDEADWGEYYYHAQKIGECSAKEYEKAMEWGKGQKTSNQCIVDYFGEEAISGRKEEAVV